MNQENSSWIFVCNDSEIEMDDLKRFDHKKNTFCIYKIKDGIYATDGMNFNFIGIGCIRIVKEMLLLD